MRNKIIRYLNATLPSVDPMWRGDANETIAMARQLEHFFAKIYEVEYPLTKGRKLIPVDTSVPSGASAHTYRMFDEVGQAKLIASYADDLPLVNATGKEYANPVRGIGDAFFLSIQDIRASAMLGVDLDTRLANTARDVMERKLDALMASGDSTAGLGGFATNADVLTGCLNGAGVTGGTDVTGSWVASATAAQIQADLEKIAKAIFVNTKGIHGDPDSSKLTVALPTDLFAKLSSTRLDGFNMITLREYLIEHCPFIGEIVSWSRLDAIGKTGGASSGGGRVVVYSKDADVVQAVIPQEFEMLPMQPKALGYYVPCHMRFGGVTIRYPKAMQYVDGC
jgi:hypothetical protein